MANTKSTFNLLDAIAMEVGPERMLEMAEDFLRRYKGYDCSIYSPLIRPPGLSPLTIPPFEDDSQLYATPPRLPRMSSAAIMAPARPYSRGKIDDEDASLPSPIPYRLELEDGELEELNLTTQEDLTARFLQNTLNDISLAEMYPSSTTSRLARLSYENYRKHYSMSTPLKRRDLTHPDDLLGRIQQVEYMYN